MLIPMLTLLMGHETNNGGAGIQCKGQQSILLYDFWESEALRKYKLTATNSDPVLLKQRLQEKGLPSEFLDRVFEKLEKVKNVKSHFRTDFDLLPPQDLNARFIKKGCKIIGVASFNDAYKRLEINQKAFEKMSTIHQEGLLLHEAVYWVLRRYYAQNNSRLARFITSCAFNDDPCRELKVSDNSETYIKCYSKSALYSHGFDLVNNNILSFYQINGINTVINNKMDISEIAPCQLKGNFISCEKKNARFQAQLISSLEHYRNAGYSGNIEVLTDAVGRLYLDGKSLSCKE